MARVPVLGYFGRHEGSSCLGDWDCLARLFRESHVPGHSGGWARQLRRQVRAGQSSQGQLGVEKGQCDGNWGAGSQDCCLAHIQMLVSTHPVLGEGPREGGVLNVSEYSTLSQPLTGAPWSTTPQSHLG